MSSSPYHGLRPFNRDETDIFFGREQHTDELITRLSQQNFLAITGYSGCGKSSLIRAGLIPSLQAGFLAGTGTHWQVAEFRPTHQPFANLTQALLTEEALGEDYRTALVDNEFLKQGSLSLHELLAIKPLANDAKLLIVCDQFEEIFRYYEQGAKTEAEALVKLLLTSCLPYRLADGVELRNIYVVLTMRSDFLGDCALFSGLAEAINNGLYLTPRLNREQLREAIEEPAFVFGGEVAPDLVVKLLEDAAHNPDQLPLLQHALMRMWRLVEKKQVKGEIIRLTLAIYEEIETLAHVLSNHADDVFSNQLTPEQQTLTEIMFKALCERGDEQRDTRRPQKLSALATLMQVDIAEVIKIIDIFRNKEQSFLVPPVGVVLNADSVIDISHESFIRQWKKLRLWSEEEAKSAKNYLRLADRATQWKKGGANFLQSPELEVFLQWYKDENPTPLWTHRYGGQFKLAVEFLLASEKAQQATVEKEDQARQQRENFQKRLNRNMVIVSLGAVLVIISLISFIGYYYGYVKKKTVYCNSVIKQFGFLECVGEFPESQQKQRQLSYEFIYKGAFNSVQKVRAINSEGKCTDNHSIESHLDIKELQLSNTPNNKTSNLKIKECQWEFVLNNKGNILYEDARNKDNHLVWGFVYSLKTNTSGKAFYVGGKDLKTEFVKFEYSKEGYEKEISYYNRKGEKQLKDVENYHKIIAEYDEKGNKTSESYFGLKNHPVSDKHGVHQYKNEYDENGNEIESSYFGFKNQNILDKNKIHKWKAKYEKGNRIEVSYFGLKSEPILNKNNIYKWKASYDKKGNRIEVSYFSLKGEPILNKKNYHTSRIKYNEKHKPIEISYFDVENKKILKENKYHKAHIKYDGKDNRIEISYFGLKGQPISNKKGIHKYKYKYDDNTNLIEESFFGSKNQAIVDRNDIHKYMNRYDKKSNLIEESYFGVENRPILYKNSYHKWTAEYDKKGNKIKESVFDQKGNKIKESVFNLKNNLCFTAMPYSYNLGYKLC